MNEIKKYNRVNLNEIKYTNCLKSSYNYHIYAEIWYLDNLTNRNWFCYVFNDFEAIMPIPYKSYFGIKIISQPIFCQQLGIFSNKILEHKNYTLLIKKIKLNLIRTYNFNEENSNFIDLNLINKTNFILDLNKSYKEIYKNYNKNRKSDLKKIQKIDFKIDEKINHEIIIKLLESNYKDILNQKSILKLKNILADINFIHNQITIYSNNEIISSSIFLISKDRIINFLPLRNKKYKKIPSQTLTIDFIIQKYSNQNFILDFEGSNNLGIARFFKSFGSTNNNYKSIKLKLF